ncbi:MAG: hypothetical protein A2682_04110 [Candidatus Terrybacteria bacterium RIFCSPHIGHO2_01_FULL_58_15]|uniref:Uncharacterized protein n=1 Tax=Terrybacteria sp. (strain RIFCSPHIGHO2_01_FULL_58_15) TaxID=1802363 RepID=A0A1G2PJG9_TERXR|nr:MAG: hypothetical protein A2682_04110 [Candidatus Terrybacteria bacterium RIFCSPHIGHO2_01_FULL_58_15]
MAKEIPWSLRPLEAVISDPDALALARALEQRGLGGATFKALLNNQEALDALAHRMFLTGLSLTPVNPAIAKDPEASRRTIVKFLRQERRAHSPQDLVELFTAYGFDRRTVRDALWGLLDLGQIEVTPDRKLHLSTTS